MSDNEKAAAEVRAFNETKSGVKGLVGARVNTIPPFFVHPNLEPNQDSTEISPSPKIPLIDLQGTREKIVSEVLLASETFGFFVVVNHGIPEGVLEEMMEGLRRFNEQSDDEKMEYYTHHKERKMVPTDDWRDTFRCSMVPQPPSPEELPIAFRDEIIQYSSHVQRLGTTLCELLSEALGLNGGHFNDMDCDKHVYLMGHFYPPCPEPHLTHGISKHTDSYFLTILLQDQIGGLQVVHQNQWIDVTPLPGALCVNVGDLLQLVSNDKFKSVEHRVLANRVHTRISMACFFGPPLSSRILYGPIKELLSKENPPKYKEFLVQDYAAPHQSKELYGKSVLHYFRVMI